MKLRPLEPMGNNRRIENYTRQTGRPTLTPRQGRRVRHKHNQALARVTRFLKKAGAA
jgi:hypothetical protein